MTTVLSWTQSQNAQSERKFPSKNFRLAKHYNFVILVHSSKEVKAAVSYRGCNEVDEVDRPQSGGAGCGRCSTPHATVSEHWRLTQYAALL
jgi:hypothetical protein